MSPVTHRSFRDAPARTRGTAAPRPATAAMIAMLLAVAVVASTPAIAGPGGSESPGETLLVVERERSALAVVEDGTTVGEITDLGDLRHATVKFAPGTRDGYVISRDGRLSRLDVDARAVTATAEVGESSIGFIFVGDHIAVANYDPKDVVILDRDLQVVRRIETGSRNVGIKSMDDLLVFSCMDTDQVMVVDASRDWEVVHTVEDAGAMPFDALLAGHVYVVGFFKETGVGLLDLRTREWRRVEGGEGDGSFPLKVPHFGLWGVVGGEAFVPAVGAARLDVVDLESWARTGSVELPGSPVFASVSPDGRTLAVNFSGDHEDEVAIVDAATRRVVRVLDAGDRVMHLRFGADGARLHVSSHFDNTLRTFDADDWTVAAEAAVPAPSGVFRVPAAQEGGSR